MTATHSCIVRAHLWHSAGFTDAVQGRASLAALLMAAGDDVAWQSYLEGWRAGMAKLAA